MFLAIGRDNYAYDHLIDHSAYQTNTRTDQTENKDKKRARNRENLAYGALIKNEINFYNLNKSNIVTIESG